MTKLSKKDARQETKRYKNAVVTNYTKAMSANKDDILRLEKHQLSREQLREEKDLLEVKLCLEKISDKVLE